MSDEHGHERLPTEWERLNAYLDGELDAEEAREVAARLAADPEYAALARVVDGLRASLRATPAPPVAPAPGPRTGALPRALARAACLLAAALVAGSVAKGLARVPGHGAQTLLALGLETHVRWLAADRRAPTMRLPAAAEGPHLPDLSRAGLRLAVLERVAAPGGAALHAGYRGPHGCRVSLLVLPAGAARLAAPGRAAPRRFRVRGTEAYAWRAGGHTYLLLSAGMDRRRLAGLARLVAAATRARRHLDERGAAVMAALRAHTRPCART